MQAAQDRILMGQETPLDSLWADRGQLLAMAGMPPDPWQAGVLNSTAGRMLLLCTRQAGKSTTAGALALLTALIEPPALILLLSPTQRQSSELFHEKILRPYQTLGRPVKALRLTATELHLENGSRVVSLPENEEGIRGFAGVSMLVIDEASRVSDDLYRAVRPMLAVSNGRLIALSTPFGKRGWFFEEWGGKNPWQRVRITAEQCPRISKAFLREERMALGERWYRQEYMCNFEEVIDAVFAYGDIQAALKDDLEPWIKEPPRPESEWFGGGDM